MTQPTSLLTPMSGAFLPSASPVVGVSDDERTLMSALATKLSFQASGMLIRQLYYDGLQRLTNLGISVPPALAGIRTVVGWPRICVDPLVERAHIDGFWIPGEDTLMSEIADIYAANDLDTEFPLTVQDQLTLGRGYMIAGAPDADGDAPIVTVESPFNLTCNWDPRTRRETAAYQSYEVEGVYRAVLYLPDATISMSRDQSSSWTVDSRDDHNFGEVTVVRLPNRARSADREGRSEITEGVVSATDECMRTFLGMAIAREFYAIPQKYMLGAGESDFVGADGAPKTVWDAAMNKFLTMERDDEGRVPTLGQFSAMDPSVFTKIVDKWAMIVAAETGYPPDYFGVVSTSNPASADAIDSAQDRLNRRARQVQVQNNGPLRRIQRLAWRVANNGAPAPKTFGSMEIDWQPVETQTLSATSDAMFKQKQAGFITPASRIALRRLGYSNREIVEIIADQQRDAANQEVADVATDLEATQVRTAMTIQKDAANPPPPPAPAGT